MVAIGARIGKGARFVNAHVNGDAHVHANTNANANDKLKTKLDAANG